MKIHEYQGKELFRKFGLVTPRGFPCFSVDEAVEAATKLGGSVWVVKVQIHAGAIISGGKGTAQEKLAVMEACGIKVTKNPPEMGALLKSVLK